MFDERAFIARVESADADQFATIVTRTSGEEEQALRVYLGDERLRRMRHLALLRSVSRSAEGTWGNVVVIPGIMGSELTHYRGGDGDRIWLNLPRVALGRLSRLRLSADGRSEFAPDDDCQATGILKRYYGELLLTLAVHWTVRTFWFDWRKDINTAADALAAQLSAWFGDDTPVHIVAHSMGGLVARTFIARHAERWHGMWDAGDAGGGRPGERGGRLLMLGTPNYGSYASVQTLTGLEGTLRKLDLLDLSHDHSELQEIVNSFVGVYQMLPAPAKVPSAASLYDPLTYGDLPVSRDHLDSARAYHDVLRDVIDPDRMIYIAGYDQPTFNNVVVDPATGLPDVRDSEAYGVTRDGDGRVPHDLGRLKTASEDDVPTYYLVEQHGDLPRNGDFLSSVDELLAAGQTERLIDSLPTDRAAVTAPEDERALRGQMLKEQADDLALLGDIMTRTRSWNVPVATERAGGEPGLAESAVQTVDSPRLSSDERRAEELVTKGVAGDRGDAELVPTPMVPPIEPSTIEIGLVGGSIDQVLDFAETPVDAIAVGHYVGVSLTGPAHVIDRAISVPSSDRGKLRDDQLLLAQFVQRGTIQGELGQVFIVPDSRKPKNNDGSAPDRLIAVVGMGLPGRFGQPELTVLARELCWAVGRLGKQHLMTVLIGAGEGNLTPRDAALAWIRGIKLAVSGSAADGVRDVLRRVTFVEIDEEKIDGIAHAIAGEAERLGKATRLNIIFEPGDLKEIKSQARKALKQSRSARTKSEQEEEFVPPATLLTLNFEPSGGTGRPVYRYGAITQSAAVPEREVALDHVLVEQANNELVAAKTPDAQQEQGRFLEQLLIPKELRAELVRDTPLVLTLDTTMARIHWEMVAPEDPYGAGPGASGASGEVDQDVEGRFLGTIVGGLTRQLRTSFAPPPEPPPPPLRLLRVLVVADPAADAPLEGAQEEGAEVAELLRHFNREYGAATDNRIEVVSLIGPGEASRTNVLRHLMQRTYDVLHFAGHCNYDTAHPPSSGWLFTGNERLSAYELTRIDRIPTFIFSNACQSGITPDRLQERAVELAPSFAEAFFKQGVTNFVCTAWKVNDGAARAFAVRLYKGLLGLLDEPVTGDGSVTLEPMHRAMLEARLAAARHPNGAQTWGAYQHYGNPYLRLFDPTTIDGKKRVKRFLPVRTEPRVTPETPGGLG